MGTGAVLAIAAALAIILWPRGEPEPDLDGVPQAALIPDLPSLALDGAIIDADLAHDSRSDAYRQPFGAVPAGTEVTMRLRAAAGDLEEATIRIWDALAESQVLVPMSVVARDATGGEHGYDWWEATLPTTNIPSLLYYRFIVRDGGTTRYLEDDTLLDGGPGETLAASDDRSWQLVTHAPDFATPEWARGAVVYQIFPDRFANGDPTNDPMPEASAGAQGADRYRSGDVYGNPVLPRDWETDMPEGFCRAYTAPAEPCDEEPLGRDFYGGDLAGIRDHLGELADLGVTVLYLNPIFAAPSNHRYDTDDFTVVDPDLGTNEELGALIADADALGMRVLLDGVFNHVSSDSPLFDRNGRFDEVGACESADSAWATWFIFGPGPPEKCYDGTTYEDWFGFDTLAVLAENPDTFGYFLGEESIATRWLEAGIGGWRLDVMNEISHDFLRGLRRSVKGVDSDALILGEEWGDASAWLLGTEADSIMNYRFRRAVIGLINGDTADSDGAIAGLTPTEFTAAMEGLREDYPRPAWDVLHNLVDSHDTTRILWTLTPGADNREDKETPEALAIGKARLRLLATLQMTWPGMAGVYYGTEVGLTGHDDPDDRRPYPRDAQDTELRDWYARLGGLRTEHEALRDGDLVFLHADDDAGTLAFGRRTDTEATVTVLNLSDAARTVGVDLVGWLPAGTVLNDHLGGTSAQVEGDSVAIELAAYGSAVFITDAAADLNPPEAPASLSAQARTGVVDLSWETVDDAAGYQVWRSVLSGGGYMLAGSAAADATTYTDRGARNGSPAHYVITAVDAAGNEGPRSPQATALPRVVVADARLTESTTLEQPLSAIDPGAEVVVSVRVEGYSQFPGPTVGVRLELGLGPPGDDAAADTAGWTWGPMNYAEEADGADLWTGAVRPEEAGRYSVAARLSTDGGATWQAVGTDGAAAMVASRELVASPPADGTPPDAPEGLVATSVAETAVSLAWDGVGDDDMYRYEILRGPASGGELERVGVATDVTFTDESVSGGETYRYAVRAQDSSFNRSATSSEIEVGAEAREVAVTFTLTVPDATPDAPAVHIAGDFQGWDPGATPMTQVDATTWEITLTILEATPLQYKYTRGSWEAVEKDAGCGEVPNRELLVEHGVDGTLAQLDEVATWRDVDACP
ncbi:MAG: alpha-glucosidase C-terminal domain-containing protein [Chloroflexi bacterium]|nr:alpha-glucosidase C-terminal domain-containing protein [Chloroflexota bacterium]